VPETPLWRTPGLSVLFTASTTARPANESARVAVVLLVLSRTPSPALAGAVVAARAPRTGPLRLALLRIAGLVLVFVGLSVAPSLAVALLFVVLAGVCEGPVLSSTLTVREQHSPAAMRTQVVTTAASIKLGAFALGSAVGGHVVAAAGARAGVQLIALYQVAGVLAGALDWPSLRHRFAP